jgi:hypothetical protein
MDQSFLSEMMAKIHLGLKKMNSLQLGKFCLVVLVKALTLMTVVGDFCHQGWDKEILRLSKHTDMTIHWR